MPTTPHHHAITLLTVLAIMAAAVLLAMILLSPLTSYFTPVTTNSLQPESTTTPEG